jgi:hypothetical protein
MGESLSVIVDPLTIASPANSSHLSVDRKNDLQNVSATTLGGERLNAILGNCLNGNHRAPMSMPVGVFWFGNLLSEDRVS